jgi:uncharacterized protein YggE
MNKWLAPLTLTLGALLVGGVWLHGQSTPPAAPGKDKAKRTVTTSGTATALIKPDAARLYLTVQTSAGTVKEARTENATRFRKVKDALAALKIPHLKMKTTDVSIDPEYTRATDKQSAVITGYRVTNQVTVLVCDTDVERLAAHAARVLDTALEQGVNVVSRISFFKEDDAAIRRELRTKAVQAAVVNAEALTAGIKAHVTDTLSITDTPAVTFGDNRYNVMQNALPAGGGPESQFVAGDLVITCRVDVTCSY